MTNQDVPFSDDNEKTAITKSSIYWLGRFILHATSIVYNFEKNRACDIGFYYISELFEV